MFANIRRHQKWLWICVSTLVILSFVWYIGPNNDISNWNTGSAVGTIYGRDVSRGEYFDARKEAELRYLFSYGQWPEDDETTRMLRPIERETKNRLVLLSK